jgi:hypothetical protein
MDNIVKNINFDKSVFEINKEKYLEHLDIFIAEIYIYLKPFDIIFKINKKEIFLFDSVIKMCLTIKIFGDKKIINTI